MIIILLCLVLSPIGFSQILVNNDTILDYESPAVPIYNKEYMRKYRRTKDLVKKVYPYALYAADLLDEINNDVTSIEKRRRKKKFYKAAYDDLKEDFKYVILDMYTSEGQMLLKLVHRETGMSVYEIASKYRGKKNAELFALMGKIWDQDIKSEYDPKGADKITEHVIQDIENGIIPFDDEVHLKNKEEFKEANQEHKERVKANKQRRKAYEKKRKEQAKKKK